MINFPNKLFFKKNKVKVFEENPETPQKEIKEVKVEISKNEEIKEEIKNKQIDVVEENAVVSKEYAEKKADVKKGYIVLIGGAEDRKDEKVVLKRVLALNNAKVVSVIPTASNYPADLLKDYNYAFRDLGVSEIYSLDIRGRDEVDNEEYIEKIEKSDLIFFTGGDQHRLVDILDGSRFMEKILEMNKKGATIAGTSAGAAAASNPILYDGDQRGLTKGSVHTSKGFGLIDGITIDTHFVNRGRLGRLTQFLCTGLSKRGIGIGEDTGIIISPENTIEIIGNDIVTVVSTNGVTYTNYNSINEGDKIIINGVNVGFLQAGCIFDLNKWDVVKCKQNALETTFIDNNDESYYLNT